MKIRYMCDYMGSDVGPEEECERFNKFLRREGLPEAEFVDFTEIPDLQDNLSFDVLIFDWGLAGYFGAEGLLNSYARWLVKAAADHPSKLFLINSGMSDYAIRDAMAALPDESLANIYFNQDEVQFIEQLHMLHDKKV